MLDICMLSETGTKIPSMSIFIMQSTNSKHIFGWPDLWNFGLLNGWGIFITWFCIFKYVNYTCNERNVREWCDSVSHPPGTAAPLHEVIPALTHSVCQGHAPPLASGADFEGFQPWPESLALSSRCFSNSFQEMSIGFPPTFPFW